uniref:hypothetical protein n=1 Tax=Alistipes sp. TaxID=1872444 RepID=UPI0040568470
MKNLFTLGFALLFMVGCSDDEPVQQITPNTQYAVFVGDLENTPNPGSHFSAYSEEEVEFDLEPAGDKVNLMMPKIRFVEQMPVWIPMEIRSIEVEKGEGVMRFSLAEATPYYHGLPYNPDGKNTYQITNLEGEYNYSTRQLRIEFDCMTMHVHFAGNWNPNSLQIL